MFPMTAAMVLAALASAPLGRCSDARRVEAERAAIHVAGGWRTLEYQFRSFRPCTGTLLTERYSHAISVLLTDRWNELPELASSARSSAGFLDFVLRYLGMVQALDIVKSIEFKASQSCPGGHEQLCHVIMQACARAQEAIQDPRRVAMLQSVEDRLASIATRVASGDVADAWSQLHGLGVKWGSADENWGEVMLSLLADHWDQVGDLFDIQRRDDEFFRFVLERLDGPYAPDRARAIQQNATRRCPPRSDKVCARVRQAAALAAKRESASDNDCGKHNR